MSTETGKRIGVRHSRLGKGLCVLVSLFLVVLVFLYWYAAPMVSMPGRSWSGALPPLSVEQKVVTENLRRNLTVLSKDIGERNYLKPGSLERSADFIAAQFAEIASDPSMVERQHFKWNDVDYQNIAIELKGASKPEEIVIIGAHYDTVDGCAGADDNGSGVVGVIELARIFAKRPHQRTLRFVVFPNEEHFFRTEVMGSYHVAERCHSRDENVKAMIALETIGYFSDKDGSQGYPPPLGMFYPSKANFIAFVGDTKNRDLVRRFAKTFRTEARFPCEGVAAPQEVPGIDWSDHLYFWKFGYPAFMVTDTAIYRNPNYHRSTDTVETLDFDKMTRVVTGLVPCVEELAN